jgi:hypothetical protein
MPRKKTALSFEVLNAHEVSEFFVELGKVPQKSVTKAARQGATIIKRAVVNSSQLPIKYGFLQMSIKPYEERKRKGGRNTSGKAAFDVAFDQNFNNIFQKPYQGTPRRGSKNPKNMYYYPASMEYGFANQKGGVGGHYFMKKSALAVQGQVADKMLEVLSKDIDAIKKGG